MSRQKQQQSHPPPPSSFPSHWLCNTCLTITIHNIKTISHNCLPKDFKCHGRKSNFQLEWSLIQCQYEDVCSGIWRWQMKSLANITLYWRKMPIRGSLYTFPFNVLWLSVIIGHTMQCTEVRRLH